MATINKIHVGSSDYDLKAKELTSDATGTTQAAGDNSTKIATTAFVQQELPQGSLDINFNGTATGTTQALTNVVVGDTTYTVSSGGSYSAGTGLSLSGTTFNHSNSIAGITTQAVYPIKIDGQGHISGYGAAVTIPAAPGTLNTNNTTAQTVSSSEALSGAIKLHKVSKTGSYNDLLNKPTIPDISTKMDKANPTGTGTLTLDTDLTLGMNSGVAEFKNLAGSISVYSSNGNATLENSSGSISIESDGVIRLDISNAYQGSVSILSASNGQVTIDGTDIPKNAILVTEGNAGTKLYAHVSGTDSMGCQIVAYSINSTAYTSNDDFLVDIQNGYCLCAWFDCTNDTGSIGNINVMYGSLTYTYGGSYGQINDDVFAISDTVTAL